jgi:RNA 2',3'-cyclic 3'-phosphodiesterase
MPNRPLFEGAGSPRQPTDRLFFAIFPDADTARNIAQRAQQSRGEYGLRGKPLAVERFHITLYHLGDFSGLPQNIAAAACEAAKRVVASPFKIAFDRVGSFRRRLGNLPFVLRGGDGVAGLIAFQKILAAEMKKIGFSSREGLNYTPHVTLLYDEHNVPEQTIESIVWTASEFVLVHSLLGKTRHIILGRWPLRG